MTTENSGNEPGHSWRLQFEDRTEYLYADVQGPEDSLAITTAYWQRIAEECRRRGLRRVLVRDGLRGEPATPDEFRRLAENLLGSGLEHVRIAFHEPVSEHVRFSEFGELAMREAGFLLRVFGSEREAAIWLLYGQI